MKLLIGIATAVVSAMSAQLAYADDEPRSLSKYWDNPMPRGNGTGILTADQINWALKARGELPLSSSRVLHNEDAGSTVSKSSSTITHIYQPR